MESNRIIKSLSLKNFGKIGDFECDSFSGINLIIGENGSGKTFILKALYSAVKSIEEYRRGDDISSINEILADKLRWTFQNQKLGEIVTKGADGSYSFDMGIYDNNMKYSFSKDATTKIVKCENQIERKECNSIFIPAKEVVSIDNVILKSREVDRVFGFDDTYYDLVKAVRVSPTRGKNYTAFADSRKKLSEIIGGKVELDEQTNRWFFRKGNQRFSIGSTSEGIKKISILDRLLANGYLGRNSIIFIDELESALHPKAISDMIDMLYDISRAMNIQIFIASHSYFVIKKLCLVALKNQESIKCISVGADGVCINDLADGMPNNSIVDESIRLYEEEVDIFL